MTEETAGSNPNLVVGCGYLGRRVAERWLAQGRRVLATTRGRAAEFRAAGIEPLVADVARPAAIPVLPAVDTVLYAVGYDRTAGIDMRAVYVEGLRNLLAKLPVACRLIYVGSTGIYGDAAGGWIDESTPPDPQDESGRVVRDAELLLRDLRPDAIILRFAGIYGPGRLMREKAIRAGEPIATDEMKWLNLIHVEDGADVVLASEQRATDGTIYNVSDGHPVRRGDFYRRLADVLGAPVPIFVAPAAAERGDRRIANARMLADLGVNLRFPSYVEGLG